MSYSPVSASSSSSDSSRETRFAKCSSASHSDSGNRMLPSGSYNSLRASCFTASRSSNSRKYLMSSEYQPHSSISRLLTWCARSSRAMRVRNRGENFPHIPTERYNMGATMRLSNLQVLDKAGRDEG
ncbi:hypothetical protein AA313_de0206964 [Arthrobotrys entomopaga]|nr:hypothetical protein AA313_de0206964 [Arthrobotrys entomopaga]